MAVDLLPDGAVHDRGGRPNMGTHIATCWDVVPQNQVWVKRQQQKDRWTCNRDDCRQLFPVSHVLFKPIFFDV